MNLSYSKVVHLLQAFSGAIFRTAVQQLTRFQQTVCRERSLLDISASCQIIRYCVRWQRRFVLGSQFSTRHWLRTQLIHFLLHESRFGSVEQRCIVELYTVQGGVINRCAPKRQQIFHNVV